jgi:hypothetical protein
VSAAIEEIIDASNFVPHPYTQSIEWPTWRVSDVLVTVITILSEQEGSCCIEYSPDIFDKLPTYFLTGIG